MSFYSAYGLTVDSALPLPDLPSGRGEADLRISLGPTSRLATQNVPGIQCLVATATRVHLSWRSVGELVIGGGNQIEITPALDADEEALRLFVVGAGFGVLLHQRGLLVLHGSAVVIDGGVVGFLGAKGWGKSTTAMALRRRGHPVLSDELIAIRFDGENRAVVLPGSSPLKLWSDALTSVGVDPDKAVPVRPGLKKYFVPESSMVDTELPLRSLCLLHMGDALSMKPVSASEAFFGIVPHVYVSRFGTGFLKATGAARTFIQLNSLLKRVAVMRLQRRRDLNQLPEIAELVERQNSQPDRYARQ